MQAAIGLDVAVNRGKATRGMIARLGDLWCRRMHSDISWPVNGHYSCRQCGRRFPVPWENPEAPHVPPRPAAGLAQEALPGFVESVA